jgi:uncharacterized protein (TIGR04255 family)
MNPIPKRLKKEPLIEAIWQAQFESANAGDVLPGLLFAKLRKEYPGIQLHRLPTADIPAVVAQMDPNLRFAAKVRLESADAAFLWQVGDRVVTLNCRKPYAGWSRFKEAILDLIQTIEESGLVPQPQHHSLRYIDLLTLNHAPDLSALQFEMRLGAHPVEKIPLQMRLELPDEACRHIVQIATPAQVQLPDGVREGSVVDLETFTADKPSSWDDVRGRLDLLHDRSKKLFFAHLLTYPAVQALEPEY